MSPRTALTVANLTAAQKRALKSATTAHTRYTTKKAQLLEQRDDAVRTALSEGLPQAMVAEALGITDGMVWKIQHNHTRASLEARQRNGKP